MNLNPIALEAGAEIMRLYDRGFAIETKSDDSPVTEADRAAEAIILKGLVALTPNIPIVAEEEAAAGRLPDIGQRFFLVDPLDGTKEFISRNGEFTVNIALIENGIPTAGVVYAPALGRIFWGSENTGACTGEIVNGQIDNARPIRVRPAPSEGLLAIGSRSHGAAETQAWLKAYKVRDFVSAGSSLKFCLLATGEADIYPRLGRTMEWDTAAGHAVLNAAGGKVTRLDGSPFLYGKRNQAEDADFANPNFVAFGDPDLGIL
ncbi:3'(2'),5'-bisphosphate nucleotidase CysQ [Asticcacaulis tiandongensis]|uniref:3'(2'),5'-bisphosphate nucleotidase CysQ n=1 Tax=Asticcacaulis tiandongensis TaxID=2565365 RepID=UPI001128F110|nr:3'(2'),5'-bisphosphate nucleotidase CysQ [Asticcacaulis tiandongensis]